MFKTELYLYEHKNWYDLSNPTKMTISYGITENFALDETLDTAMVSIERSSRKKEFKPFSMVRLDTYQDNTLINTVYYTILQDVVECVNQAKHKYQHKISLIEPIKILERYLLPNNLAFRKTVGVKSYSIGSVIQRCLNSIVAGKKSPIDFPSISPIYSTPAPDFNFSDRNLLEALMEIGRYISGIPTLKVVDNVFTLDYILLDTQETPVQVDKYYSESNTRSSDLYAGNLRSDIQNMVVKDVSESEVVWPNPNVYGYARSGIGEIFNEQTSSVALEMPNPIYKINDFKIAVDKTLSRKAEIVWKLGPDILYADVLLPMGEESISLIDGITEYTRYKALPPLHSATTSDVRPEDLGKYQDTTLFYTDAQPTIPISNVFTYQGLIFSSTSSLLRNVFQCYSLRFKPTEAEVRAVLPPDVQDIQSMKLKEGLYEGEPGFYRRGSGISPFPLYEITNLADAKFNVSYVPYIDGTITIGGENKGTTIISNQQSTIVDSEAWGKNQKAVLDRTSLPVHVFNKVWYKKPALEIGDRYKINETVSGFIVNETRTISAYAINSTYSVSEGYHRISQYTALDSKWRETSIPKNTVVNRDFIINDYLMLEGNIGTDRGIFRNYRSFADMLNGVGTDNNVTVAEVNTSDRTGRNNKNLILNVNSVSCGNTLRFSFNFADNLSAGNKITTQNFNGKNQILSVPVFYTDDDGYSKNISFTLHHTYTNSSPDSLKKLPERVMNFNYGFQGAAASLTPTLWDKDVAEKMNVVYNIHCVSDADKGFTNYFASESTLVNNKKHSYRLVALKDRIFPGQKSANTGVIRTVGYDIFAADSFVYISSQSKTGENLAMVDENNNIVLYWNNAMASQTMYLNVYPQNW